MAEKNETMPTQNEIIEEGSERAEVDVPTPKEKASSGTRAQRAEEKPTAENGEEEKPVKKPRTKKPVAKVDDAESAASAAEEMPVKKERTKKLTEEAVVSAPAEADAVPEAITENTLPSLDEVNEEKKIEESASEAAFTESNDKPPEASEVENTDELTQPAEADGSPKESDNALTDDSQPSFMDIEHFFDYRSSKELEVDESKPTDDGADSGEPTEEEQSAKTEEESASSDDEEVPTEQYGEYENLTILDELEEEEKREPRKSREEHPDEAKYNPDKPRRVDMKFDLIELFVFTLVAIMILTTFVFKHTKVEGSSMNETLYENDHLIISDLFYEPKQYDVIVCEDYSTGLRKPIVKRVIATEGQTVVVKSMDEVYVDGELIDTSFVHIDGKELLNYQQIYPLVCTVPEGEVFVMGDHRNDSLDSRHLGTIKEEAILGKVLFRFFPFEDFGKVD